MPVVSLIDTLTDWARVNICEHIRLKQPPDDPDAPTDAGYVYTLVTPAAFGMYLPTSEKLPPDIHSPFPSICVRFITGQDILADNSGFLNVQFCFSTWDTGIHGEDILQPVGGRKYRRWSGDEAEAYFKRRGEGWRDAWNFVDIARRALESVTHIGGYVIDRNTPIQYNPLSEQESIPDLYPTWFASLGFRVLFPLVRNDPEVQNFL